jgi:hypothetical protein
MGAGPWWFTLLCTAAGVVLLLLGFEAALSLSDLPDAATVIILLVVWLGPAPLLLHAADRTNWSGWKTARWVLLATPWTVGFLALAVVELLSSF